MNDNRISEYEGRVTVFVDSELEDVIPGFIKEWKQDVNTMRRALDRGNYETIRSIGHKMKGTGATCGFDALTDMGRDLEASAKNINTHEIRKLLDMLASYLEQVEIVYQ